ncbi:MAG TPA: protein kinase [Acidobacteriota bacterium]|nr:protein kinase [Acidobacteriota bacterium]
MVFTQVNCFGVISSTPILKNTVHSFALPKKIGHYTLTRFLSRGGMGEVYLATDEILHRQVAIKVMRLNKDDAERRARFLREARALAALSHPNVIVIHEVGAAENIQEDKTTTVPFLVMEYVEGRALETLMRARRLTANECVGFAIQIADGLAAAHQRRILHRDIKPSNLMVSDEGRVKILDFGISKLLQDDPAEAETDEVTQVKDTREGIILGTVRYSSPEQARGNTLDPRSDIFSFGIVLYEMLTGKHPFSGNTTLETVTKIVADEPRPWPTTGLAIPPLLKRIVQRCLMKDPHDRYASFAEVVVDLKAVQRELDQAFVINPVAYTPSQPLEPVPGMPTDIDLTESEQVTSSQQRTVLQPSPAVRNITAELVTEEMPQAMRTDETRSTKTVDTLPTQSPPQLSRGYVWFKWLAVVLVLGLAAGSGFWGARLWLQAGQKTSLGDVKAVQTTISSGLDVYPTFSPDGRSMVYCSDKSGGFELYIKQLVAGGRELQLTTDGEQNVQPAWSPDGEWIAYHSKNRSGIWVISVLGGSPKQLSEFGSRPIWSPDGKLLAFQSDGLTDLSGNAAPAQPPSTIWTVPARGGNPQAVTQVGNPAGGHGTPSWSADGKWIAFATYDRRTSAIWAISTESKELVRIVATQRYIYDPIFAPDGKGIFYSAVLEDGNYGMWKIDVSPTSCEPDGEPYQLANLGIGTPRHLTISKDGKKIAYSALSMTSNLWSFELDPRTQTSKTKPVPLMLETGRSTRPVFSPDGSKIAFEKWRQGTNPDIWMVDADGNHQTQLTTDPAVETIPSWSPDSSKIYFRSNREGQQAFWSIVPESRKETLLQKFEKDTDFPRLSPDGTMVAFNSKRDGTTTNVWLVPIEGGQPKQITFDQESLGFPCWSPDGKWVALQLKRGEDTQLVVMPSQGGEITQLTTDRGQHWPHSWSPDGDKIAFAGFRQGYWNLWIISRTTREQKQLTGFTKLNAYVRYPAWSPKGNQMVFEYAETVGNVWMIEIQK